MQSFSEGDSYFVLMCTILHFTLFCNEGWEINHRLRFFLKKYILACYKRCFKMLKEIFRNILSWTQMMKDYLILEYEKTFMEIRKPGLLFKCLSKRLNNEFTVNWWCFILWLFRLTITSVDIMQSAVINEAVFIILIPAQTAGAWLTTIQEA